MKSDLISRSALLKKKVRICGHLETTGFKTWVNAIPLDAVRNAPAVDAAPVRRGRWDGDTCTACKLPWDYYMTQSADDWGYFDPMPDYCPNCGAKMDEEG